MITLIILIAALGFPPLPEFPLVSISAAGTPKDSQRLSRLEETEPCTWEGLRVPLKPGTTGILCKNGKLLLSQNAWIPESCTIPALDERAEFSLRTTATGSHSVSSAGTILAGPSYSPDGRTIEALGNKVSLTTHYDPKNGTWTLTAVAGQPLRQLRRIVGTCSAGKYNR
ncbi:MAG TPA: hypothetical protein VJB59_03555 [Bdellovibrionota bacterium]|nr:hypothetical protein [Bdellovibrionota bacterium]